MVTDNFNFVGRGGFEPPKAEPTDLQSVPFDRSGTFPFLRATNRNRTRDSLITSEVLYLLSYGGIVIKAFQNQFALQ